MGGVAYALTWMIVPIDVADVAAASLLGTFLLLPLVRCDWRTARGARRPGA